MPEGGCTTGATKAAPLGRYDDENLLNRAFENLTNDVLSHAIVIVRGAYSIRPPKGLSCQRRRVERVTAFNSLPPHKGGADTIPRFG